MVNRLRSVAALATGLTGATVALSGCSGVLNATTYHEDRRYEVPGVQSLDVLMDSAGIEIVGADTDKISVHEHLSWSKERKPTAEHRQEGGTLVLSYRCPGHFTIGFSECSVRYRVQMPRAMAAKVRTDSGNIRIRSISGDIDATADAGNIEATDLRGGTVKARTDSGNIEIDGADSVQARANAGSIELEELRGGRVTAVADSGNVGVSFAADRPPSFVQATANAGNVTLRLPGAVPYAIDSRTEVERPHVTGVINDPGSSRRITARTDSGEIHISAL